MADQHVADQQQADEQQHGGVAGTVGGSVMHGSLRFRVVFPLLQPQAGQQVVGVALRERIAVKTSNGRTGEI